ncbi:MAG: hypothetical protein IPN71_07475 [Fibrobacteres bacterium]|nr:hypothetical protein [Fibrobacterota bacterium]
MSHHDLAGALTNPDLLESLKPLVLAESKRFAEERLPGLHPMVAMFLTQGMKDKVTEMLATELNSMILHRRRRRVGSGGPPTGPRHGSCQGGSHVALGHEEMLFPSSPRSSDSSNGAGPRWEGWWGSRKRV